MSLVRVERMKKDLGQCVQYCPGKSFLHASSNARGNGNKEKNGNRQQGKYQTQGSGN
jgi:hypothetical protein